MATLTAAAKEMKVDSMDRLSRVQSLDIVRGLIMVLMAIDHVRVYSGLPAGGPDAGIFFTRWITHFCAPGFAFFAGTSAFLYGVKVKNTAKLAQYLVTRGAILVVLELTLIRFLWEFNFNYSEFILAGVIWMLGWSMIALGAMVRLTPKAIGFIGLAIIFLQQLFALAPRIFTPPADATFAKVWEFVYSSGYQTFDGIAILYVLIPWIGVMAAGYGFGLIIQLPADRRDRLCKQIGLACIALFIVAGSIIAAIDRREEMPFIFQLLNQNKYPASQLFLLMTIGPLILLLPYAERMRGAVANFLSAFGKVPFFYYLLHILIIHLSALVIHMVTMGTMHHEWFSYAPFTSVPEESRWSLGLLYAVWIVDIAILYVICRWYADYKSANADSKWLKYL